MSKIWNFPEYQMSSEEDKRWATNEGYPHMDLMDIVKHAKLSTQQSVKVKTNIGEANIVVEPVKWSIVPKGLEKSRVKDGYNYHTVWMIKGKSPTGKTSEWFYEKDLQNSKEVQKYVNEIKKAQTKFYDDYFSKIAIDLHKRLSPTAKKAIEQGLAGLIHDKKTKELRKWFIDNKFDDVPDENEFKKMTNLGGFISSSSDDKYGHKTGSAISIDWVNKKFNKYGWSSDD